MTATLTVRLDDDTDRMLDELTDHYGKEAERLGLDFNRSACIRAIVRGAYRDMHEQTNHDA